MSNTLKTAISFVLFTAVSTTAFADAGHHDGEKPKGAPQAFNGMMGGNGNMAGSMGMMMQMHSRMMNQNMMALMQGVMMEGIEADADGDGTVSDEEAHGMLQSMHANSDANDDGTLSIDEFEALHSKMVRAQMVDRFQNLDADGDGMVTMGEMTAPADQMDMPMRGNGGMGEESGPSDN
ncbi:MULTISPECIES: calcium-binding protein [Falsihalocynthiibacter]|uniref:calcium-binding protein n=1 Tax=Falsihalocynthiibacter TaxID=2854182 RepID=UPI0030015F18